MRTARLTLLLRLSVAITLAAICCPAALPAAAAPQPIPPAEALRMGMDRFVESYAAERGDHSEATYDDAYTYYGKCLAKANDARASRLPARRRELAKSARKALEQWDGAFHELEYLACGGGTMYTHAAIRAVGPREEQFGKLVGALLRGPVRSPSARAAAARLMKGIDAYVRGTARLPAADDISLLVPDLKTRYPEARGRLRQATARLRGLSSQLPDEAARELLARPAAKARPGR